ncbi:MAG: T9SS type A sorting domain-containing protein [Porphyromonadaceae bacterium]|nr:T9SS type A sorting domain-containing protein [Porphyromonadaceae bacterium]
MKTFFKRTRVKRLILISLSITLNLMFVSVAFSQQPGDIDLSFNTIDDGYNGGEGEGANSNIYAIHELPDEKILIGGSFGTYNLSRINGYVLSRLNSDGSIDFTFNEGNSGPNNTVYTIVGQPDGKILIGGHFTTYNGVPRGRIARLNSDGTLDESFNPGSGADDWILNIVIQSDGKIIVAGQFTKFNDKDYNRIVRLNSDGSIDETFHVGQGFDNYVWAVCLQDDGKIYVGGAFSSYDGGGGRKYILRLKKDGTIDTSFYTGNKVTSWVRDIVLGNDGRVYVAGRGFEYNAVKSAGMIRFNKDGTTDFASNLFVRTGGGYPFKIILEENGDIVLGGAFTSVNERTGINKIAKVDKNGILDDTFDSGKGFNDTIRIITKTISGDYLVGGRFELYNGNKAKSLAKIHSDGTQDLSFNKYIKKGTDEAIRRVALQSDGKMLIGGEFDFYNGVFRRRLARIYPDGTLDESFKIGYGFNKSVYDIAVQSGGKILVGGSFGTFDDKSNLVFLRLNLDGTPDETFKKGVGPDNTIYRIKMQPDGKIFLIGAFTKYDNVTRGRIVKLNSDGSLDTSFDPGVGFNDWTFDLVFQSDGKMIVAGSFTKFKDKEYNRIIRLNSDGSLDDTFKVGSGFSGNVRGMAIQPDDKILVGGAFTSYNGETYNRLVRLNPDGSVDETFNIGVGANSTVYSIEIQADGRILVAGYFNRFNNEIYSRLVRLNSDGSIDKSFNSSIGANNTIYSITPLPEDKIMLAGEFTAYNGVGKNHIAIIHLDYICKGVNELDLSNSTNSSAEISWDGTENDTFQYQLSQTEEVPNTEGTTINGTSISLTDLEELTTYYFHIRKACDDGNYSGWKTLAFTLKIHTGIANLSAKSLNIYPNPNNGIFSIQHEGSAEQIKVFNTLGEQAYSLVFPDVNEKINISNQPGGIYFVNIHTRAGVLTKKIILNK